MRPLELGVTEQLRHPGVRRSIERSVAIPGLSTSSASVPDGAEVGLSGVVEATGADVVVTGTLEVPWTGECRRCLAPVEGRQQVEVREVFARHPVEGETYPLANDTIDLEPMVREAVLLALPLAPLCATECAGPDPDRFPASAHTDGTDDPPPVRDPRWAALDDLRFDDDAPDRPGGSKDA